MTSSSVYTTLTLKAIFIVAFSWKLGEASLSPRFTSQPQQLGVLEGGHVILRCAVIGLGEDHVVFWNHGSLVLTMNERVLAPHRSLSVTVDDDTTSETVAYSLRLDSVTLDDEGDYSCQLPAHPSLVQRHEIVVNVVPTITEVVPDSGWMEVVEDDDLELTCRAAGKPDPVITWTHRRHQSDADGERSVGVGEVLSIDSVTRQDGGLYVCTADNGAGSKSRDFVVDIQYGPLAEVVDAEVYVGYDQQAEISCIMRGNPAAEVTWIHNDTPINTFDINVFANSIPVDEKDTSLAKLTIHRVGIDDVGNYRCVGSNGFGLSSASLAVIGLPVNVTVKSDREAVNSDSHRLSWTVHSLSPLISHQLQLQVASESMSSNGTESDWQLLELSADDVRDDDEAMTSPGVRHLRYSLTGLTANTSYAGRLRAANVFGSSDWSSLFDFKTAASQAAKISTSTTATTIIPARQQRANNHPQTTPNDGSRSSWTLKAGSLVAAITLQLTECLRLVHV